MTSQSPRSEKSELLRKKHLYRRLIMTGKISLPYKNAKRIIGPDCAYHLYATLGNSGRHKRKRKANK